MTALIPDRIPASAAVRVEGGLLSAALISAIRQGDRELPAIAPSAYGLPRGERLTDAASRKWNYLKVVYAGFRQQLRELPENVSTTKLTREQWLYVLLDELGYGQRIPVAPRTGIVVPGGREPYRISHEWQPHLPVHLLAWDTPLDRPTGKDRAAQSMLQELLNASNSRLWGLLSNGRVLRVLRDSTAITGSSYVEFDLEGIFERELFPDFLLLFTMLHASRFTLAPKTDRRRRPAAETEDVRATEAEAGEDEDEPDLAPDLGPADCPLEWWRQHGIETGTRARDRLRNQVKEALTILGTGFLSANPKLREALARGGKPALDDFHHELLRLAYQLIFLFVAEDRGALLDPDAPQQARDRYADYFSTARLRRIASRRKGDGNRDLWEGLVRVLDALGRDGGLPALALPALGGLYFRTDDDAVSATDLRLDSAEPLRDSMLRNEDLLDAIRLFSRVRDDRGRTTRVDFRHLGADELGSVYESLLELMPRHKTDGRFWLQELVAGNKRKTTGSYYTPSVLIEKLLDNALDPVIDRYAASGVPDDLLKIRVVDPSCGSGHMIVAAARRIALKYAVMYTGDHEPAPEAVRAAMAKVVRSCVHGVDINPLAAEIAKVSLWLESLQPGEPLAYLDDRVKVGNALLGATPALLELGLPDGAFKKLAGDDPEVLKLAKAENKKERPDPKQGSVRAFGSPFAVTSTAELRARAEEAARQARRAGNDLEGVRRQARLHRELEADPVMQRLRRAADAWCAAFLWRKAEDAPPPLTSGILHDLQDGSELSEGAEAELRAIVTRNRFFHWHLEFPHVFRVEDQGTDDHNPVTGWQGGFDAVLGNPPWERVKIQEKEWFAAAGHEGIAEAANASERKRAIAALLTSEDEHGNPIEMDRNLHRDFQTALREAAGTTNMLRDSGIFPLTGTGDVNTYAVFAEKARHLLAPQGMAGMVLPTGIATDKTTSPFFADLVDKRQLMTVLDFENEEKLFPDVHNQYRFCLFTICGHALCYERARLAFRARRPEQLDEREFRLDAEGFRRINPNTRTSPICEGPDFLRVLEGIHERVPVLWRRSIEVEENAWGLQFQRMFDMASDSGRFLTAEKLTEEGWALEGNVFVRDGERALPLYEGKFIHHFDSRFATFENATQAQINKGTLPRLTPAEHSNPTKVPLPRYWVHEALVEAKLKPESVKSQSGWQHDWVLGRRNVSRASDQRTVIVTPVPRTAAGDKLPLILPERDPALLLANLSSYALDFAARQKHAGASISYFLFEQLPVLAPQAYDKPVPWLGNQPPAPWIRDRTLEMTYTSYEMGPWAQRLGDDGPPFIWDEDRRFVIRAELDAAYFHLYGIPREDLPIILDSFRAFRNKTPDLFHATNAEIIRVYDAMAKGVYTTELDPPPAHGRRHRPGTSPLTRPSRSEPEKPHATDTAEEVASEPRAVTEPGSSAGLFSISEIGHDEQLGFWN